MFAKLVRFYLQTLFFPSTYFYLYYNSSTTRMRIHYCVLISQFVESNQSIVIHREYDFGHKLHVHE